MQRVYRFENLRTAPIILMRIVFITRSTLHKVPGGDSQQVLQTARMLKSLAIEVDVKLANEKIDYEKYDLLHFFNIIRPSDMLVHIKRSKKPFVVSTILIDYSVYDKQQRPGFTGKLFKLLPIRDTEYIKTLYRCLLKRDSLVSIDYLWKGQQRSIKEILSKATCVLVQAKEEYNELVDLYQTRPPFSIVKNGVDTDLFTPPTPNQKENNLVLCVARVEGLKNQYNLIQALNNTSCKLVLIGNAAPNQKKYYRQCKKIAAANITFISHLPQQQLVNYYAAAKVHVLPSWFEVCGLSSLEAAAMGCQPVITANGYASSYFGDNAIYCNPAEPSSILEAVKKAMKAGDNRELQKNILQNYTWQKTAEQTLSVYKKYIKQCSH
jgi:glycosyltransferase involved in cell wall biosynthesis